MFSCIARCLGQFFSTGTLGSRLRRRLPLRLISFYLVACGSYVSPLSNLRSIHTGIYRTSHSLLRDVATYQRQEDSVSQTSASEQAIFQLLGNDLSFRITCTSVLRTPTLSMLSQCKSRYRCPRSHYHLLYLTYETYG